MDVLHPDRLRRLALEAARLGADGPGRWWGEVGGVLVTSLGVPTDWSVQAHAFGHLPDDAGLAAVIAVLRERGTHGAQLLADPEHRHAPLWARFGLQPTYDMPVFALTADAARGLTVPTPPGTTFRRARDREEFVAAYGGWCGGRHLAELLVAEADVASGRHDYWVVEHEGDVVATAILHAGTAATYVSGIGVHEPFRGRGIGAAVTAAATREAARRLDRDRAPVDLVWMHASADGAPLYARLGFRLVDTHVGMSVPPDDAPAG